MRLQTRLTRLEQATNGNDSRLIILTRWPGGTERIEDTAADLTGAECVQLLWGNETAARTLAKWIPAAVWNNL